MVNKVLLIGNLGKDPAVKNSTSGTTICKFSLATQEHIGGEKKTEWHNIVCFGKVAETCEKYLRKGSKVYIEGRIQTNSWEKDGEKKYMTEIVANNVRFLDSKGQQEPSTRQRDFMPSDDEMPF